MSDVQKIQIDAVRKLDRKKIRELSSCCGIDDLQNAIITGKTGVGKSYVAYALAQQACRKGYRAIYRRTSRLFDELRLAHADGTYPRLLARLARVDAWHDHIGDSTVADAFCRPHFGE